MNGNKISLVAYPASGTDASNKNYVDDSITNLNLSSKYLLKSSAETTYATITQLNTVNGIATSKLPLSGGVVKGNITMETGNISLQAGHLFMGNTNIYNVNYIVCNSGISIASGSAATFLKGDGSTDDNTYLTTANAESSYF